MDTSSSEPNQTIPWWSKTWDRVLVLSLAIGLFMKLYVGLKWFYPDLGNSLLCLNVGVVSQTADMVLLWGWGIPVLFDYFIRHEWRTNFRTINYGIHTWWLSVFLGTIAMLWGKGSGLYLWGFPLPVWLTLSLGGLLLWGGVALALWKTADDKEEKLVHDNLWTCCRSIPLLAMGMIIGITILTQGILFATNVNPYFKAQIAEATWGFLTLMILTRTCSSFIEKEYLKRVIWVLWLLACCSIFLIPFIRHWVLEFLDIWWGLGSCLFLIIRDREHLQGETPMERGNGKLLIYLAGMWFILRAVYDIWVPFNLEALSQSVSATLGVQKVEFVLLVAGCICLLGAMGMLKFYKEKIFFRKNFLMQTKCEGKNMRCIRIGIAAWVILCSCWTYGLILPYSHWVKEESIVPLDKGRVFAITNPGLIEAGAKIYGQLGCVECHSQNINGFGLWENAWAKALQEKAEHRRVTLPDDYKEDPVAFLGFKEHAPDLSNLGSRIESYLLIQDARPNIAQEPFATLEEWFLLHLYNPRASVFNTPWSRCPAMPYLFKEQRIQGQGSPYALPVSLPPGKELVPKQEALLLVAYLKSLRKNFILPDLVALERKKYIPRHHSSLNLPPKHHKTLTPEENFARLGEKTYLTYCVSCHGADGSGDGFNYPPLKDSDWLKLPEKQIAQIILLGLRGKITVNGQSWDNYMTALGPRLNDEQIRAVVDYVRTRFAQQSDSSLTPEQIHSLRKDLNNGNPLEGEKIQAKITIN